MTTLAFAPHLQFERPEHALTVCCGCSSPSEEVVAAMRGVLAERLDWDLFLSAVFRHRLVPLAYRSLSGHTDRVPAFVLEALRSSYRFSAQRNLILTAEMVRIIDALSAKGVAAMPVKGPSLAIMAFGDLSMRQFSDIDILVRPCDLQTVKAMLLADGYTIEHGLSARSEAEYIRSEHAFRFTRADRDIVVELHWRLNDRRLAFILDDNVWERLGHIQLYGRQMLSLGLNDLVVYLCIHGAKHFWENLEWVSCLAALLRSRPEWDWEALIEHATSLGGRRLLQVALLLVRDMGNAAVVREPLGLMKPDPVADALVASVWRGIFGEELEGSAREIHRYKFYLRTREKITDRLRVVKYCSVRIPHPDSKDWSMFPMPTALNFLYYVLRPIRLLKENGIQPLKGVLRPDGSV